MNKNWIIESSPDLHFLLIYNGNNTKYLPSYYFHYECKKISRQTVCTWLPFENLVHHFQHIWNFISKQKQKIQKLKFHIIWFGFTELWIFADYFVDDDCGDDDDAGTQGREGYHMFGVGECNFLVLCFSVFGFALSKFHLCIVGWWGIAVQQAAAAR